jgi:hypothetical protein
LTQIQGANLVITARQVCQIGKMFNSLQGPYAHIVTVNHPDFQGFLQGNLSVPVYVEIRDAVGFENFIGKLNNLLFPGVV